ncbi:hypothetical protein [Candidatus Symbiopectobacterium sp.]|uniref:hypothetical protein n=1 Tax=Candidatus Symbiopectobacterium sp. TaxID=2816440 RepID=UPI0025C41636|nr:hypothetical protein [Candidatus Symbiopectobacterium sp.]
MVICSDDYPKVLFIQQSPDKPVLPPAGQALRRSPDGLNWENVRDYRGKTVYNTRTRGASTVEAMGELPEEVTLLIPATEFDT